MKISFNWLKDLVSVPVKTTAEEVGSRLMLSTVELEGIEKKGEILDKIVVGEVRECAKHPNADRLSVTKVDIGSGKLLNIVCGAPNVAAGQKVAVALPGTVLPNGLKLERREVRGILSEGMICAEDEIGLGTLHEGIMVLPKAAGIGKKLSAIFPAKDVIFEVDNKSLSNRPDLWGHYGMAREVAALFGQKLKKYEIKKISAPAKSSLKFEVRVQDKKLCPRYMGAAVTNIKIGPSPEWLRWRLESVGVRSINNIVDITNYVMLELGQPLHAFDFDKLEGARAKTIVVRSAKKGEAIDTLDGAQRKLEEGIIVIADAKNLIAIAGVMGGKNTEVDDQTTTIIFESANFDFASVRKTSTRLGLRTEASVRFEKGLDPNLAELGIRKALAMVLEIIPGAKLAGKVIDIKNFKSVSPVIKISLEDIDKKIGQPIPATRTINILKGLGFGVTKAGKVLNVKVPTWRAIKDVSIPEDLVEEVARIYGYENITGEMPLASIEPPQKNKSRFVERTVKNILFEGLEMTEVYGYSFVDEKVLRQAGFDPAKHIKLKNSINKNLTHLRQSLIPGLISDISQNQHFFDKIRVFEIGTLFYPEAGDYGMDASGKEKLPQQDKSLAGMILEKGNETPFYEAKDAVVALLGALRIDYNLTPWAGGTPTWAHPERSLQINSGGKTLGIVAELNPDVQRKFGIKHRVGLFGINFDELIRLYSGEIIYRPVPKYPEIELDLAMVVPQKTVWADVLKNVFETDNRLIKEVRLLDVYEGKGVETGKKSLAFRVSYRSDERTLKLDEVKKIEGKIVQNLGQKFSAKLRV